ncbi:MAG: thiamine pyrophosphate-binding protein [Acidimicrobiia bacterium]|nr:thiamine pyrophosphate-binding protein [Acidimicrobiia bacterium]
MTDFAKRLARILADRSNLLFGVPGGGPNLDLVGAANEAGMRFVLAHGETAAAIMASTYGLLTGGPTGVVVTRGPGATSAANGAAQATLDRFPLVVITDCVTAEQTLRISHQRFDQRALFAPITVASVTASGDLAEGSELAELVDRAARWPAGAVHLDYDPGASSAASVPPTVVPAAEPEAGDSALAAALGRAVEALTGAERPVVIVGMEAAVIDHRATIDGREPPLRSLLEALGCPVLTTYQAVGLVPTEGPLSAGLYTNGALEQAALDQADLIVTIGLDTVEPIPTPWNQTVPVITVSSVPAIDRFIPADVALLGDPVAALGRLLSMARGRGWDHRWLDGAAASMRGAARDRLRPPPSPERRFGPVDLVDAVRASVDQAGVDPVVTVDAGAHFLAIMPLWPVPRPFDLLISNGLATMGFSLPAAVGAALARPGRPVVSFVGDGGLAMTMAELETIARLDLPITVVVFNDSALSLIAIKQGEGHGGPQAIGYQPTDFAAVAQASGLEGTVAESAGEVRAALASADGWSRPRLVDARIDPTDYRHLISATRG